MKLKSTQACQVNTSSVFQVQLLNVGVLCLINASFQSYDTRVKCTIKLPGSCLVSYLNNSQTVHIYADMNNTMHKHRRRHINTPAQIQEEEDHFLPCKP